MKKTKKIILPLVLLILLCSVQMSFAESKETTYTIKTMWQNEPYAVLVATKVTFDFTVNKNSSDVVTLQFYHANVDQGNATAYEQNFKFLNTQILKNDEVQRETSSSDFDDVPSYSDPDDIDEAQECTRNIYVLGLDQVRANYMWWSYDCYPSTFLLDTEIDF